MSEELKKSEVCPNCQKVFNQDMGERECGWVDFTNYNQGEFWQAYNAYVQNHLEVIAGGMRNQKIRDDFSDPDARSKLLKAKHKAAWSRKFHGKTLMNLTDGKSSDNVLEWKSEKGIEFRLASDTIFTSFIGYDYLQKGLFEDVLKYFNGEQNYRAYIEGYTRKFYRNIGSFLVFPRTGAKDKKTINQLRGCDSRICQMLIYDRFDLTLECIRLYYEQNEQKKHKRSEQNLLFKNEKFRDLFDKLFNVEDKKHIKINQEFFDLFGSFQEYVDFFCLNDLIDEEGHVRDLVKNESLKGKWLVDEESFNHPFPANPKEYLQWMNNQLEFVQERTQKINQAICEQSR